MHQPLPMSDVAGHATSTPASARFVSAETGIRAARTTRNRLLGALEHEDFVRVAPHLERIQFEQRQLLLQPYEPIRFVYFPETAVVSLVSTMSDGATVEVGTAGNEGMVGLPLFLGEVDSSLHILAQIPGSAMRLEARIFMSLACAPGTFHKTLLRYTHAFLTQVAQTAACNGAHLVEERCARWLLMTHDRVDGNEFPLTHEFMASMLGVRRPGVTIAMRALQEAGSVKYSRGWVEIVDRQKLELTACECYRVARANTERLFSRSA